MTSARAVVAENLIPGGNVMNAAMMPNGSQKYSILKSNRKQFVARMRPEHSKCPHENIVDCPLYHGMHIAGGPSCVSNRLDEGLCAVSMGADYESLLVALTIAHPKVVAECEWNAALRQSKEQRDRNMRTNGLH